MRFHLALRTIPLLLALAATPVLAQKTARATSRPTPPKAAPKARAATAPRTARRDSLVTVAPPAAAAPAPAPQDAARTVRSVAVHQGPGGRPVATLAPGTVVVPVTREGGWVKVRLEAWVQERELVPADTMLTMSLAAADLRADPAGTRGRMVRWEVELLAFQVADALRRELAPDEPYLLVRGPGDENAMLYLALPPSLVATARGLPPLTRLLVTARVRNGRSAPAGLPVLDLLALTPLRRN